MSSAPQAPPRPLIPTASFPEPMRRFVSPETPEAVALMVARGLVPMPPPIKLCALYQVAQLYPAHGEQASQTLFAIPSEQRKAVLSSALPSVILEWVAELAMASGDSEALIWVLSNPKLPPQIGSRLISVASAELCERVGANQALLGRAPHLLKALCLAPQTPKVLKDKLTEWAQYMKIPLSIPRPAQGHPATASTAQPSPPTSKGSSASSPASAPASSPAAPPTDYSELGVPRVPALSRAPLQLEGQPPVLSRFLAPESPEQAVKMLISGAVPMPSHLLLLSLYHLSVTRPTVGDLIPAAVDKLAPSALIESLASAPSEGFIDWLAERRPTERSLLGAIISHPMSAPLTLARLALDAPEELAERLALNQARWLESPIILQALYFNPQLRASSSDRLIELAAREGLDLSWLPESEALIESLTGQVGSSGGAHARGDELFAQALQEGQTRTAAETLTETIKADQVARGAPPAEPEEGAPKRGYSAIMMMNVAQKIRLALLGSQSDRALLVKDSNKVVARAAIRSPSVSVSEALMYARNSSLSAPIIEYIANNKKWMQNYRLRAQVVMNPKTPAHIALQALNTLRPPELKAISQSHSVPSIVSQRAKAIIKSRQG